jgi:hypothetical protein
MGTIVSKAIRESAKRQDCTLRIEGVCNYDNSTTVWAHLPDESKGMATKSDDISGCYACCDCHIWIDQKMSKDERNDTEWYMRRAMIRSWRVLIDQNIIKIKGYNQ